MDNTLVLIPAYNEAKTIRPIVEAVLQHCHNVLVIDDGSTDDTADQIDDLPILLTRNPTNIGKGETLLKGFKSIVELTNIDNVITIDADNQHDPADIPRLIAAAKENPGEIIIAARLIGQEQAPPERLRANKIGDFFISWAAGHRIKDTQSGFRLYPFKLVKRYVRRRFHAKAFAFEGAILIDGARLGFRSASIPIQSVYPEDARLSHYNPFQDTMKIIRMVAWRLLKRGMCPIGLYRALKTSDRQELS